MNNHAHVRIVCLKNENSLKNQHHQSGLVVPQNFIVQTTKQSSIVPSLAYLSARLQSGKDVYQNKVKSKQSQTLQNVFFYAEQAKTSESKPLKDDSLPSIQKYVQGQKTLTANKKSTIKHMMGSVDFSLGNKRQKKIVKVLKQTIQGLSKTQGILNKKQKSQQNYINLKNQIFLQQDFHNFLANKQQQLQTKKLAKTDQEKIRLQRLTVINPEKQSQSIDKVSRKLNLFNFQQQKQFKAKIPVPKEIILNSPHIATAKARLQQKMFKMQLHQTNQHEPFNWSRMKSKKGYSFQTLNL